MRHGIESPNEVIHAKPHSCNRGARWRDGDRHHSVLRDDQPAPLDRPNAAQPASDADAGADSIADSDADADADADADSDAATDSNAVSITDAESVSALKN